MIDKTLYSSPMFYATRTLGGDPEGSYRSVRAEVLGKSNTDFVEEPLEGQVTHMALITGAIRELQLPTGIFILDTWTDSDAAAAAMTTHIQPALTRLGLPAPETIPGLTLIGCIGNPGLAGFNSLGSIADIRIWRDLGMDARTVYSAVSQRLIGNDQPLLDGGGIHLAYLMSQNRIITFEIWRDRNAHQSALHDRIMPEMAAVFHELGIKGDPDIIEAKPMGIAVREEVRFINTT